MTLEDFLMARYAEDEAAARDRAFDAPIHSVGCFFYEHEIEPRRWTARDCDCSPEARARVLADVMSKRRILHLCTVSRLRVADQMLKILASPYGNHPDCKPEWGVTNLMRWNT